MTDERLTPTVVAWLKGTAHTPYEPEEGVRHVMARVPQVRQRRRRWPLRAFHWEAATPTSTTTDTVEYQPTPIPASNVQTPTVIGRTRSMFSPVKAITAGAIVFALGAAFLIAQPFGQGDPAVPGATADDVYVTPVAISAETSPGGCTSPTTETSEFMERSRGGTCHPSYRWNDERLNGRVTWAENEDVYTDGSGLSVRSFALSIENEVGAWRSRPVPRVSFPDSAEPAEVWVLDGEGGYEGLTAVLVMQPSYASNAGYIIGEMPEAPENASPR